MNKHLIISLLVLTAYTHTASAQNDTLSRYYYRLATSPKPEDRSLLKSTLYRSIQQDNEKNWMTAWNYFFTMKEKKTADSIEQVIKVKFPGGLYWRQKDIEKVYNAKGAEEKEKNYLQWIAAYPPDKFDGSRIVYDYASNDVARAFAQEKKTEKAIEYADKVETPAWRGEGWAGVASDLEKNGFVYEALPLYKKAIENAYAFRTSRSREEGADFASVGYPGYCTAYAGALRKEKQYDSALTYIRLAEAARQKPDLSTSTTYARILEATGKNEEAFAKADEFVKTGYADAILKDLHRSLYTKTHPGGKSYESYMNDVQHEITKNVIANLKNTILDQASPTFVLKDTEGHTVSSESLKGKTVILDFWATWCGPCKRSFPAMQMAVNKYKNDPNVKFLFIHTWEHGDNDPTPEVKKFIRDNHYSFRVLMDRKDPVSATNKVVEAFGIQGIPSKFVIDKKGRIRFRMTGFTGTNEAAVEELSAMIEMAKGS